MKQQVPLAEKRPKSLFVLGGMDKGGGIHQRIV